MLYKYHEGTIYTAKIDVYKPHKLANHLYENIMFKVSPDKLLNILGNDKELWRRFTSGYFTYGKYYDSSILNNPNFYVDIVPHSATEIHDSVDYTKFSDRALYNLIYTKHNDLAVKEFLSRHFDNETTASLDVLYTLLYVPNKYKTLEEYMSNETILPNSKLDYERDYIIEGNTLMFNIWKGKNKRIEINFSDNIEIFVDTTQNINEILHSFRSCTQYDAILNLVMYNLPAVLGYVGKDKRKWDCLADILMNIYEKDKQLLPILHHEMLLAPRKIESEPYYLEMYLAYRYENVHKILSADSGNKITTKHAMYSILTKMFPGNKEYRRQLNSIKIDKTKFMEHEDDYLKPLKEFLKREGIKSSTLFKKLCKAYSEGVYYPTLEQYL